MCFSNKIIFKMLKTTWINSMDAIDHNGDGGLVKENIMASFEIEPKVKLVIRWF